MADAGLRPGEATALAWEHVGARTLLVEQASSGDGGAAKGTKTGAIRTVRLLAALVDDLAAWRSRSARDGGPLFPRRDGTAWTMTDYRNWRRRRFDPAAETAGLVGVRPYDLRHSFASLMIQSGYSPVELAAELGHAPTLTLNTYAHVFSEFARGERVDPERSSSRCGRRRNRRPGERPILSASRKRDRTAVASCAITREGQRSHPVRSCFCLKARARPASLTQRR